MRGKIRLATVVLAGGLLVQGPVVWAAPWFNPEKVKNEFLNPGKREIIERVRQIQEGAPTRVQRRLERVRQRMLAWLERVIERLERVRERVKNQTAKDEFTEIINWFEEQKSAVENAETLADLREVRRNLAQHWRRHRFLVRKRVGLLICRRMQRVIARLEKIAERLGIVDEVESLLGEAKDLVEEAKGEFSAISSESAIEEAREHLRSGRDKLHQAREKLVEVRQILRRVWEEKRSSE